MAITDYLLRHQATNPVSFHMPGHKGSRLFRRLGYDAFLDNIVDIDITEIPGADNLFQTEGIIAETMARYRRLYGSRQTYLLINGSSSGLIASILATTEHGDDMIVARNCHKSIFSGVEMAGVRPVYAYPQIVAPYGISGPVSPEEVERCLREHPRAAAVILPSPNYYGICSDIAAIAEVVHRSGKILIVDQAHGAHLKFLDAQSLAAEDLGADIVICSTHKTLASFTESAVANVMGDRVSLQRMEDALGKMESEGLVTRQTDTADMRVMKVCLTDKGRGKVESVREIFHRADDALVKGIPQEELDSAMKVLRKMLENLLEEEDK